MSRVEMHVRESRKNPKELTQFSPRIYSRGNKDST